MRRGRLVMFALVVAMGLAVADSEQDERARQQARKYLDELSAKLDAFDRILADMGTQLSQAKDTLAARENDMDRADATAKLRELQREQKELQKEMKKARKKK